MRKSFKRLQQLIDAATAASSASQKAYNALNEYCEDVYGFAPADKDLDSIIDAVFGGCGQSNGMSAVDFDAEMQRTKP